MDERSDEHIDGHMDEVEEMRENEGGNRSVWTLFVHFNNLKYPKYFVFMKILLV